MAGAERLGLVTKAVDASCLDAEVTAPSERLLATANQCYGYFESVKEAVNRLIFPTLDEDVPAQVLATRLSDFYGYTHPMAAGETG